jgi:predicted RNA-binding protein with PIN domain
LSDALGERREAEGELIVDGLNVLGSRPDGWWRDRPAAMRRLVLRLNELATREGTPVLVVFDGRPHKGVAAAAGPGVEVEFAPGGPDAADRVIAARVRSHPDPAGLLVASSDRRLRNAVKAAGGRSIGAGELIRTRLRPEADERE